ncbi:DNA polymerase III subunit delta', partial [Serratia sp. (in: enterobacteria)]
MNWYPWLNGPYRQLIGQYAEGRGHHALLLHAAAGNGDDALAYGLSRWLICQQRNGEKSCGECHSCRLMLAGNHPDYHVLAPEKGKSSLGIEPIRQVIETLYAHAQQGGAKVIWLPQAEQLTEAAANALLKTLEEPPEKTYFLLGCREPSRLMATLRSRCLYWHLASPEEQLSLQWLSRQAAGSQTDRLTALRLHDGAPL